MQWAFQRKFYYAIGAFLFVLIVLSVPLYRIIFVTPSCSDGKQNGDERGTDCGGSCALMCQADVRKPIVHWSRMFKVTSGVYDALAYVENPNIGARTDEAIYRFKVYDVDNILILERVGKTRMEAGEAFAVFLGGVKTGEREPRRVFFEFEPDTLFTKGLQTEAAIVAVSPTLESPDEIPRLTATLKNRTALPVSDIDVVAILYAGENAVVASATHVDGIKGNGEEKVLFTWSQSIPEVITRIEIIPRPRRVEVR